MPKQTCSKAKRRERAVGWDHSQRVPELLHCDRAVWGCVALRSAQPVWCGPSVVLGRSCLQPNPCSCQDFPRKSCSGFFLGKPPASVLCHICSTHLQTVLSFPALTSVRSSQRLQSSLLLYGDNYSQLSEERNNYSFLVGVLNSFKLVEVGNGLYIEQ